MELMVQLVVIAVLATAEFCAEPIELGIDEPQFCRVETMREISTPYFSIVVEPNFLVGVDREGRRLRVQSTLFKNQDQLAIEVLEGSAVPTWSDCIDVKEFEDGPVTWQDCHIASNDTFERRLAAALNERHVLIQYSYASAATRLAPALERMTQSVKVHAN